jgi:hypothetical protein
LALLVSFIVVTLSAAFVTTTAAFEIRRCSRSTPTKLSSSQFAIPTLQRLLPLLSSIDNNGSAPSTYYGQQQPPRCRNHNKISMLQRLLTVLPLPLPEVGTVVVSRWIRMLRMIHLRLNRRLTMKLPVTFSKYSAPTAAGSTPQQHYQPRQQYLLAVRRFWNRPKASASKEATTCTESTNDHFLYHHGTCFGSPRPCRRTISHGGSGVRCIIVQQVHY